MRNELEATIREAATEFATKFATALARYSAADEWIDQRSCAPLSKRQFLRLVAGGELLAQRLGKRRLVRRRDLDRYIERRGARDSVNAAALTEEQLEARTLADLNLVPNPKGKS